MDVCNWRRQGIAIALTILKVGWTRRACDGVRAVVGAARDDMLRLLGDVAMREGVDPTRVWVVVEAAAAVRVALRDALLERDVPREGVVGARVAVGRVALVEAVRWAGGLAVQRAVLWVGRLVLRRALLLVACKNEVG